MRNTTGAAIPAPAPRQTIHQHGTNWPLILLVGVISAALAMWLFWAFLAFLFWMMDFSEPGQQAAATVFWLLVVAIVAIFAYIIGGYFIGKWFDGKIELQREINYGLRNQALTAQAGVTDSRQISEDARLCKLVMLVMFNAYQFYAQFGEFSANDPRPWSRRSVAALTIAGEQKPVGETIINGKVKRLLVAEDVIIDEQINVADFPTLDFVREMLERKFTMPVKFYGAGVEVSNSLPDQRYGFSEIIQK